MEGTGVITAQSDSIYLAKTLLRELVEEKDRQFRQELVRNTLRGVEEAFTWPKTTAILTEKIIV